MYIRRAECDAQNLELQKYMSDFHPKMKRSREASNELHCLCGDFIGKKKFSKEFWNENLCFQICFELQFHKHIPNGKLWRLEYAIKIIDYAKDPIAPPSETELVANSFQNQEFYSN